MKILLNLLITLVWFGSLWICFMGKGIENQRLGGVIATIIMCIFFAKELIIYEIEKLKPRQDLKGEESNSTGESRMD